MDTSATTIIGCSLICIGMFLGWEFVAWFTHKYVMHGFLWVWHRSHHTVHDHAFERNDWFFIVFSMPSIALISYFSLVNYNPYGISAGIGILCYGIFYVVFHDIVVHQRIRWRPARQGRYSRRMINAHYIHHKKHTREGCEAFGFLYAPKKYEPGEFTYKVERNETQ